MKPIRILIIDDQYARYDDLSYDLLSKTEIAESGSSQPAANGIEAFFCSGQRVDGNVVTNDYGVIAEAVKQGWGADAAWQWNLVLLDVRFDSGVLEADRPKGRSEDDKFGLIVRKQLRGGFPDLPVVMFSGKHESKIIESNDSQEPYLSKDGINERELMRVLLDCGKLDIDQARKLLGVGDDIAFASKEMINVYRLARVYAESDQPILILGETGSGKENLAKYLHHMSSRSIPRYEAFNTATIPEGIAESILFGTLPGTGANTRDVKGYFELATGGRCFLTKSAIWPCRFSQRFYGQYRKKLCVVWVERRILK